MRRYRKVIAAIFIITGTLLLCGFVGVRLYCSRQSNTLHVYHFSSGNFDKPQDGLSFKFNISKKWEDPNTHPDTPFGGQYDFTIRNSSNHDYYGWTVTYEFDSHLLEDSSWNGAFEYLGNNLTFKPSSDLYTIPAGKDIGFGGIYYAARNMSPNSCVIRGFFDVKPQDFALAGIINVLIAIWIVLLIYAIMLYIRTSRYEQSVAHDAQIIEQTMNTITSFIDAKDPYTRGHSIRVACYAQEIARRMKYKEADTRNLYYITLMHDCGKIGIPDSILKKPGKLTFEEYEQIKTHTIIGNQILKNFTAIPGIREGAHYHHEHYDGKGYPEGLKGEEIPLFARIICVADSYDAMSSTRCYRPSLSEEKILDELTENAGKQFDPNIVPIMKSMINDGFVNTIQVKYPMNEHTT